ncbi:MAG: hypothetical protein GY938_15915 [Ketobacter sp.]|nr:hypothetical protein [Ketobacter sp.]
MVRVRCAVVVALMAGEAVLRRAGVTVGVARLAVDAEVCALERERGRIVVEARGLPATHLVAVLAGRRKAVM